MGSLDAGCEGELEVEVPLLVVVGEPEELGMEFDPPEPWNTGALGSLDAGCEGELEVEVPLLVVVGDPGKKGLACGAAVLGEVKVPLAPPVEPTPVPAALLVVPKVVPDPVDP